MKRVHLECESVSLPIGDGVTRLVEEIFTDYGVSRASDLPEEGKVRLMQAMQRHQGENLPDGLKKRPISRFQLWMERQSRTEWVLRGLTIGICTVVVVWVLSLLARLAAWVASW